MFSPIDEEMLICVGTSSGEEWEIVLNWACDKQEHVLENFRQYVEPITRSPSP
jgi:hypothetical protein